MAGIPLLRLTLGASARPPREQGQQAPHAAHLPSRAAFVLWWLMGRKAKNAPSPALDRKHSLAAI